MQTQESARGLDELIALSGDKRTTVMCAEAVPWRCHRSLVADALSVHGIPVVEILSVVWVEAPPPRPGAGLHWRI
jgi:uncharacterized protein (DUF488 family)